MIVINQKNVSIVTRKVIERLNVRNLKDQENAKIVVSWDTKPMFVRNLQNQKYVSIVEKKDIKQESALFPLSLAPTARVKSIDIGIVLNQRNLWLATTVGRLVMVEVNVHNLQIVEIAFNQVMSKRIVKTIMLILLVWFVDQKNILRENVQISQRNVLIVIKKAMRKLTVQNLQKTVIDLQWHVLIVKEKGMEQETVLNQGKKERDHQWLATIAKVKVMEQEIAQNQNKKEMMTMVVDIKGRELTEQLKTQFLNFERL